MLQLADGDEGPLVLLRMEGVDIVLSSRRVAVTSSAFLLRLGVNPLEKKLIAFKLGYILRALHLAPS